MRFWAGLAALAVVGGICTALVGEDAKTGGKSEEKKDGSLLSKITPCASFIGKKRKRACLGY